MSKRTNRIVAALIAVGVLTAGVLATPSVPATAEQASGDAELGARLAALAAGGFHPRVSAVVIDDVTGDPAVRIAHLAAGDTTEYEVGSITKTMTGALLAVGIERGEVEETTRLGELLEVGGAVADVSLLELATHTSGLPSLPETGEFMAGALVAPVTGANPLEGATLEGVIAYASTLGLEGRGGYLYSNIGFALLGHALAEAAGEPYADLIASRLLDPLGLEATRYPGDDAGADAPRGYTSAGRLSEPWANDAYGPAGTVRSTAIDIAAYAVLTARGEAPGSAATQPRSEDFDGLRIGYGWRTDASGVLWHDGGTGGFSSMVLFNPVADRMVVVLNASAAPVAGIAWGLLA